MKITKNDKEIIRKTYNQKLENHPMTSAQAVFWKNECTQFARFKVLADIADLNNSSILDVGCGVGDFFFYLNQRFENVVYEGFDIVPRMIESAKEKYSNGNFKLADIEDYENSSFDFVVASGVFTYRIENYMEKYMHIIKKMFDISRKGVAFNMLRKGGHIDDELYIAYDPEEITNLCKKFSKKVEIVKDYLPQDFTVYLRR